MAETLSLLGIEKELRAAGTMQESELQVRLHDLDVRLKDLDYSPTRQGEVRRLQGRIEFELAARAVEAMWFGDVDYTSSDDVGLFTQAVREEFAQSRESVGTTLLDNSELEGVS
jgi:hypothetical protein